VRPSTSFGGFHSSTSELDLIRFCRWKPETTQCIARRALRVSLKCGRVCGPAARRPASALLHEAKKVIYGKKKLKQKQKHVEFDVRGGSGRAFHHLFPAVALSRLSLEPFIHFYAPKVAFRITGSTRG